MGANSSPRRRPGEAGGAHALRLRFEQALGELTGRDVGVDGLDAASVSVLDEELARLFGGADDRGADGARGDDGRTFAALNRVLVFYGVGPVRPGFFAHYLAGAFGGLDAFEAAVERYQTDAIRLFATFGEAFRTMNGAADLAAVLRPIAKRSLDGYAQRAPWRLSGEVHDQHLTDLGYLSAAAVRQEEGERAALRAHLDDLAATVRAEGREALWRVPAARRDRIDSLLRKFKAPLRDRLFVPLFAPDADEIEREARTIAPKSAAELARMEETQQTALRNLASYLTADALDVYVATSMRTEADFVSVNEFVRALFASPHVAPLHLRYFNPTQSWIDDRIAKGLVEALMLKRATVTVYMAQKSDTFGKDSEASVALGQGKPVIVYVPKLHVPAVELDSDALSRLERPRLVQLLTAEGAAQGQEVDTGVDEEQLRRRILQARLARASDAALVETVRRVWADFGLYDEAHQLETDDEREHYRAWLDAVVNQGLDAAPAPAVRAAVVAVLTNVTAVFEKRARVFREVHPLALQVILSSGVLNGMLVVRSVESCAAMLVALLANDLPLVLQKDAHNCRLIERTTGSTIRVITRHRLLRQAFEAHAAGTAPQPQ